MIPRHAREAYSTLGLHPSASLPEVHAAYHMIARAHRNGQWTDEQMATATAAYDFIIDRAADRPIYHPAAGTGGR